MPRRPSQDAIPLVWDRLATLTPRNSYWYFWKPLKTRPISSGRPRSATASVMRTGFVEEIRKTAVKWPRASSP
jgi:hypothetical protein